LKWGDDKEGRWKEIMENHGEKEIGRLGSVLFSPKKKREGKERKEKVKERQQQQKEKRT
jgi:hypothetical protein